MDADRFKLDGDGLTRLENDLAGKREDSTFPAVVCPTQDVNRIRVWGSHPSPVADASTLLRDVLKRDFTSGPPVERIRFGLVNNP
jgi:hypothetical protein